MTPLPWITIVAILSSGFQFTQSLPVSDVTPTKTNTSVLTSISLVADRKESNHSSNDNQRELKSGQELPASPAVLLSPDKFQFQAYNSEGNLVLQQMTKQQIQSLTAAGGGHMPVEVQEPQKAGDVLSGGMNVADVIQKVQDILKEELQKPVAFPTSVTTIPGHVNSEWGNILPSILSGDSGAPVQEPEVPATTPKPSKPVEDKLPEEKPMILVPTINVEDKEQKEDGDLSVFDKVNAIESTKRPETLDQDAGASEAIDVKPVTVNKPEGMNSSDANPITKNVTVVDVPTTTAKAPAAEEASVQEEALTTANSVNKTPEPTSTVEPVLENKTPEAETEKPTSSTAADSSSPSEGDTEFTTTSGIVTEATIEAKSPVESTPASTSPALAPSTTKTPDHSTNSTIEDSTTPKAASPEPSTTLRSFETSTLAEAVKVDTETTSQPALSTVENTSQSETSKNPPIGVAEEKIASSSTVKPAVSTEDVKEPATLIDPLPTELAASVSSMLSQVSEVAPAGPSSSEAPVQVANEKAEAQTAKVEEVTTEKAKSPTEPAPGLVKVEETTPVGEITLETSTTAVSTPSEVNDEPAIKVSATKAPEAAAAEAATESKPEDKTAEVIELNEPTTESPKPSESTQATSSVAEVKTTEAPKKEEASKVSEKSPESQIICLNITKTPSEMDSTVPDGEKKTESPMTKIQSTLSTIHQTLEASPVQASTPPVEAVTLPPTETAAPNKFASDLIAGVTSAPVKSIVEASSAQPLSQPSTAVTEKISEATKASMNSSIKIELATEATTELPKEVKLSSPSVNEGTTEASSTKKIVESAASTTSAPKKEVTNTVPSVPTTTESPSEELEEKVEVTTVKSSTSTPLLTVTTVNGSDAIAPVNPGPTDLPKVQETPKVEDRFEDDRRTANPSEKHEPTDEASSSPKETSKPDSLVEVPDTTEASSKGKDQKKDSSMEKVPVILPGKIEVPQTSEDSKWTEISQDRLKTEVSENLTNPQTTTPSQPELIALGLLKSTPSLDSTSNDLSPDISYFVNLCNDLAFSFWKAINSGLNTSRSLVVSPFGMTSTLAMIFLGARGPTSTQMNDLLKLDGVANFNPHLVFQNITDSVGLAGNGEIVNAAFVRELFAIKRDNSLKIMPFYKKQANQFYDGIVSEVNFNTISDMIRRKTNLAIRKQTGGKIRDLISSNSIYLRAPLAAFSANVFQTNCHSPDATSEGRDGELYFAVSPAVRQRKLVPVPATLWRAGVLAGYEPSLDATAIALGDVNNIVSTIFVLPGQPGLTAPGDTLDKLEGRIVDGALHNGAWNKLLKVIVSRPGLELQVPKFSHRSLINATAALKAMGLPDLFEKHADFKGMSVNGIDNNLFLADVLQMNLFTTCGDEYAKKRGHHEEIYPQESQRAKVMEPLEEEWPTGGDNFMKFLEEAVSTRTKRQTDRLKLDRPFLYFVRHNPTGLILHMGRFNPRLMP